MTNQTNGRWVFHTAMPIEQVDIAMLMAGIEVDGLAQGATVTKDLPGHEENPTPEQFTYETTRIFTEKQPMPIEGEWHWLEEQDWNATWKASIEPIREGRILIIPPWLNDAEPVEDELRLIIEPGQAFGTGHHETTMHCIRRIEQIGPRFKGARVADVGTGTGILALLAAAHGATVVDAVDIDPQSIRTAQENLDANSHLNPDDTIRLREGSTAELLKAGPYDIVIANMITPILLDLSTDLHQLVKPDGLLIMSGVSMPRVEEVMDRFTELGFTIGCTPGVEWAGLVGVSKN